LLANLRQEIEHRRLNVLYPPCRNGFE
jgi:hypothetical protein